MINPALITDPDRCMKCGFCMSSCPVYDIDHNESHVARGRNMLIKMAYDNELPLEDVYKECLDSCILCKRCEAVCPANLSPTEIAIRAKQEMIEKKGMSWLQKFLHKGIAERRSSIARIAGLAALIPGISVKGGRPLRHLTDMASFLSGALSFPSLSSPSLKKRIPQITKPKSGMKDLGEVAIFPGCVFEFFLADIGEDIILTLVNAGFKVVYPEGLNCCGLAVHNAGDFKTAKLMAIRNIEILSHYDHIVTGCATCGSALKNYGNWLIEDDTWKEKAREFSEKVSDLSEFLFCRGFRTEDVFSPPITVTYHDPCHLKFHQGIFSQPRELLKSINGIKYIEMESADACCGMGGSFSISNRETSLAIQEKKMEAIRKTEAQVVVTSCPGCILNLTDGIRRKKLPVKAMHISQFLNNKGKVINKE